MKSILSSIVWSFLSMFLCRFFFHFFLFSSLSPPRSSAALRLDSSWVCVFIALLARDHSCCSSVATRLRWPCTQLAEQRRPRRGERTAQTRPSIDCRLAHSPLLICRLHCTESTHSRRHDTRHTDQLVGIERTKPRRPLAGAAATATAGRTRAACTAGMWRRTGADAVLLSETQPQCTATNQVSQTSRQAC